LIYPAILLMGSGQLNDPRLNRHSLFYFFFFRSLESSNHFVGSPLKHVLGCNIVLCPIFLTTLLLSVTTAN
jgi:hypothetical protein